MATHADHVSLCARDSAEYVVSNAVPCDITHVRKGGRSPFSFSKNDFDEVQSQVPSYLVAMRKPFYQDLVDKSEWLHTLFSTLSLAFR